MTGLDAGSDYDSYQGHSETWVLSNIWEIEKLRTLYLSPVYNDSGDLLITGNYSRDADGHEWHGPYDTGGSLLPEEGLIESQFISLVAEQIEYLTSKGD